MTRGVFKITLLLQMQIKYNNINNLVMFYGVIVV
jgi:hypothetical protein